MRLNLLPLAILAALALLLIAAGCTSPKNPEVPVVYIVYGSGKGDHSYTDAAYRGILNALRSMPVTV